MQAAARLIQKIADHPSTEELILFVADDDELIQACIALHKDIKSNDAAKIKKIESMCSGSQVSVKVLHEELDRLLSILFASEEKPSDEFSREYAMLGLKPGADLEAIKKAFRKLSIKYHPDTSGSGDSKKFIELNQAYKKIISRDEQSAELPPHPPSRKPASWNYQEPQRTHKKVTRKGVYFISFLAAILFLVSIAASFLYQKKMMMRSLRGNNPSLAHKTADNAAAAKEKAVPPADNAGTAATVQPALSADSVFAEKEKKNHRNAHKKAEAAQSAAEEPKAVSQAEKQQQPEVSAPSQPEVSKAQEMRQEPEAVQAAAEKKPAAQEAVPQKPVEQPVAEIAAAKETQVQPSSTEPKASAQTEPAKISGQEKPVEQPVVRVSAAQEMPKLPVHQSLHAKPAKLEPVKTGQEKPAAQEAVPQKPVEQPVAEIAAAKETPVQPSSSESIASAQTEATKIAGPEKPVVMIAAAKETPVPPALPNKLEAAKTAAEKPSAQEAVLQEPVAQPVIRIAAVQELPQPLVLPSKSDLVAAAAKPEAIKTTAEEKPSSKEPSKEAALQKPFQKATRKKLKQETANPAPPPENKESASAAQPAAPSPESLRKFLNAYTSAYAGKDLHKFARLFAEDATENGAAFSKQYRQYIKLFDQVDAMLYEIDMRSAEVKNGNILLNGRFRLILNYSDGRSVAKGGTIAFLLMPEKDSYLIKALSYRLNQSSPQKEKTGD